MCATKSDTVDRLVSRQINLNLPDKRDYLILYTRFIFLVTVKAGCENVFFVPDPLGDHWYVSEHDYE